MPRQLAMISSRHKRTVRISLRAKASGQDIAMAATEALGAVRISLWRQLECWEWSEYRYGGAYRWSGFRHACGRRSEYRSAQKRAVRISLNPKARGQNIAKPESTRSEYRHAAKFGQVFSVAPGHATTGLVSAPIRKKVFSSCPKQSPLPFSIFSRPNPFEGATISITACPPLLWTGSSIISTREDLMDGFRLGSAGVGSKESIHSILGITKRLESFWRPCT